jgi:predicted transcriptional regulator of viral defense system
MHYKYITSDDPGGITHPNRKLIDELHRTCKAPFTVKEAASVLGTDYGRTKWLLAYWTSHGWLSRIRRGLYVTVPLGAKNPSAWSEDPWIMAMRVFEPCYIGGWSACEHWNFTEQIFRGVVVVTSRPARRRHLQVKETPFVLKTVKADRLFGTTALWRRQTQVQVSDPSRTLVDLLNYPDLGGGMRHVAQVLREYVESSHKDVAKLLEYIKRLDNRTIYKRLGYVLEVLEIPQPELLKACRNNLSTGYSLFDSTARRGGSFNRRWGLQVNVNVKRGVSKK